MTPAEKISLMRPPSSAYSEDYHKWNRGRGVDVWTMICAAITGDLAAMKTLVARDPKLIHCEIAYLTPIYFAARENHRHIIDFLVEKGVRPIFEAGDDLLTVVRDRGYTALIDYFETQAKERYQIMPGGEEIAALIRAFDIKQVRAMIEKDATMVHAADRRGNKPIHWAALTRQIDLIDFLLEKGANIDDRRPDGARPIDLTNGDYHYRNWYRDLPPTGLQKHEVVVGHLMARGAYCDISVAAKIGYYDRVKELLDEDPGLVNRLPEHDGCYSGLPLRNASGAGHVEIVKLLLERGANPNEPEPGIAPDGASLHGAISRKHMAIVKLLLEHGANPNAQVESSGNCAWMAKHVNAPKEMSDLIASYGGAPSLEMICYDGDVQAMATLLLVNPQMKIDGEALGSALGHRPMMELILQYQPDILKDFAWNGRAPAELVRWLMQHGLDPMVRDWLGATMLHHAASDGKIDIAEICLEFGADINALETGFSSTPLGLAAKQGKKEMAEWLLKRGADPNIPADEPWALPAAWARRRGHHDIAALLQ